MRQYFAIAPGLPPITDYRDIWNSLPLVDMMKRAGGPPTDCEDFVSHAPGDPWWDQFGYLKPEDRFDVPSLQVNSWYDFGVAETLQQFNQFRANALSARSRDNQFIIISPTEHCRSEALPSGPASASASWAMPACRYWDLYFRWFDHWLKGIDNGVTAMPPLRLYVMGRNHWRDEQEWPLARTRFIEYYLHSGGRANSRFGDGTLSPVAPGDEPPDSFTYDRHPRPLGRWTGVLQRHIGGAGGRVRPVERSRSGRTCSSTPRRRSRRAWR